MHGNQRRGSFSGPHSLPAEKILERLCHLARFSCLTKKELQQITAAAEFVEVERKGVIYGVGDDACHVFVVLSGMIKQISSGSRPLLVGIAGAGEIIGLQSLFEGGRHRFTAAGLTSSKVARINADHFMEVMSTNKGDDVRRILSITIGPWLQTLEQHPVLTITSIRARLDFAFLELARKFGTRDQRGIILNLPLTHALLADMIGARRPTVSEMVMDLERKGIVVRDCRRFVVDVEALRQSLDAHNTAQRMPDSADYWPCPPAITASGPSLLPFR